MTWSVLVLLLALPPQVGTVSLPPAKVATSVCSPAGAQWMVVRGLAPSGELVLFWWEDLEGRPGGRYVGKIVAPGRAGEAARLLASSDHELCVGEPGLAFGASDHVLLAWVCRESDTDVWRLEAQAFSLSGPPVSPPATLAHSDVEVLREPVLVGGGSGEALALWRTTVGAGPDGFLQARLIDGRGKPLERVEDLGGARLPARRVAAGAALGGGGYAVAWVSGERVVVERLDAAGRPRGEARIVNDTAAATGRLPSVAVHGVEVWVAWSGRRSPHDETSLFARRLGADGGGVGPEVEVSTSVPGVGRFVGAGRLATDGAGNGLAVWSAFDPDGDVRRVYGRWLDAATGLPAAAPFRLDDGRGGERAQIGVTPSGDLFVDWLAPVASGTPETRCHQVMTRVVPTPEL